MFVQLSLGSLWQGVSYGMNETKGKEDFKVTLIGQLSMFLYLLVLRIHIFCKNIRSFI